MRHLYFLLVLVSILSGCKKDTVDGSSIKDFQTSINSMATTLSTLEQTKFNEALYVLKTFGVEGKTDIEKLEALAKLINGKNISEIFALADEIALKNDMEWSSKEPPSLGEMNIFQTITATELDPNDIVASGLNILVKAIDADTIVRAKNIRVTPVLIDNYGKPIEFSNAGLETIMEVFSNGAKLATAKNIMTSNDFNGFQLRLASLPSDKIVDNKIDIKVSIKASKKTYQLLKAGIIINEKALTPVKDNKEDEQSDEKVEKPQEEKSTESENTKNDEENDEQLSKLSTEKPETIVNDFLNKVGRQNFKAAYNMSENPNWGSYDNFSNPNLGFGAIKNINVKNINPKSSNRRNATIDAVYEVVDKDGKTTLLNASYGLKNTEQGWKIISYKVNSSEKQ